MVRGMITQSGHDNAKSMTKIIRLSSPSDVFDNTVTMDQLDLVSWAKRSERDKEHFGSLFNAPSLAYPGDAKFASYLAARLTIHEAGIVDFFQSLEKLDSYIVGQKLGEALRCFVEIHAEYGWSFLLLSRMALLHATGAIPDQTTKIFNEHLEARQNRRFANYYFAFFDIFDIVEDYGSFEMRFLSLLEEQREKSEVSIVHWLETIYTPLHLMSSNLLKYLHSFSEVSVYDLAYIAMINMETGTSFTKFTRLQSVLMRLSEAYFANDDTSTRASRLYSTEPSKLYRVSGWFCPSKSVLKWRASVDKVQRYRAVQKKDPASELLSTYRNSYFSEELRLKHIGHAESGERGFHLDRYEAGTPYTFLRSVAAEHCLLKGEELGQLNQVDAKKVLSHTENLALRLSKAEIRAFHDAADKSEKLFVAFLALCLLFDKEPDADTEFAMRMQFQVAVREWFHGDVIELLRWLTVQTPALAEYVFRLCSSSFVDKLYLLVPTFEEGLELKEKVLRWAHKEMGIEQAGPLADKIAKERRIRLVRGSHDDSRVFVDEAWLSSWIAQNVVPIFSRYRRSILGLKKDSLLEEARELLSPGTASGADEAGSVKGGGSHHLLLVALQTTFSEFCNNEIHGIRSYLGRRILHGTLEGHLVRPIQDWCRWQGAEEFSERYMSTVDEWREAYAAEIKNMQQRYLRVQSKAHPDGLIRIDIRSPAKRAELCASYVQVIASAIIDETNVGEVALALPDFCWSILQVDLTRIQTEYLPIVRQHSIDSLLGKLKKISLSEAERDHADGMLSLLEGKHRSFATWFRRPEQKLMSASVGDMVESIIAAFQGTDRDFAPELELMGHEVIIHGDFYHQALDILEILIGNVHAWGKSNGSLIVERHLQPRDETRAVLYMSVQSQLPEGMAESHRTRIKEAMLAEDLASVADQVGNTGIRRIRQMLSTISDGHLQYVDSEMPKFIITLPILKS